LASTRQRGRLRWPAAQRLAYDYLVLATGASHSYFGRDDWAPFAPGLKTIEDATEIRRRVLLAFELAERQMVEHGWHPPLNFVVIGGGPTGVELAGAISDIAQLYMRHDFRHIDPAKSRVLLLEGSPRVLGAYPEDLSAKAEAALGRLGVEVHTHTHVTGIGPGWVEMAGKRIDAAVTLWAAGVEASPLGRFLGAPLDRRGSVLVDDRLNPPGLPEVFVLGDLAHLEQDGHQVPGVAQPAMQMGDHVAKILAADLAASRVLPSATSTKATWPPSAAWTPWPGLRGPSKPTGAAFPPGPPGSRCTSSSSSASATVSPSLPPGSGPTSPSPAAHASSPATSASPAGRSISTRGRDITAKKRDFLTSIADAASTRQDRYSKSEVKFVATFSIAQIQKQIDQLSKEFRELDTKLQELNWQTELV
jgi:hypothetical protein